MTRPAEHFIHGVGRGSIVIVPARVWVLLEQVGLQEIQVTVRGRDPELDQVLTAGHAAANEWRKGADVGTSDAVGAVPVSVLEVGTSEAARRLGIQPRAVRKAIAKGRLAARVSGGVHLVEVESLEQYRETRRAS